MSEPIGQKGGAGLRARHLLWTIPAAVLVSLPMFFIASISLCGVSGCSGGGFGVSSDSRFLTWVMCGAIGLAFVAAIGIPRWLFPRSVRMLVAILVGVGVAGMLIIHFLSVLGPTPH